MRTALWAGAPLVQVSLSAPVHLVRGVQAGNKPYEPG